MDALVDVDGILSGYYLVDSRTALLLLATLLCGSHYDGPRLKRKRFCILYFWLVLFYGFCIFFFILLSILNNHYSELSDKLPTFHLVLLLENSRSFIWGLFLCLPILFAAFYLFLCIRYICKDSQCSPLSDTVCDWPWATCLEQSAIHSMWLILLGLFVCRKNQDAH